MRSIIVTSIFSAFLMLAVTSADMANADDGADLYALHCASCHGAGGEGGSGPSHIGCSICDSLQALTDEIEADMPPGNPTTCTDACAEDTAAYIFEVLNGNTSGATYTVYLPHITGGYGDWTDYLQADNDSLTDASFSLALYDSGGTSVYQGSHDVPALGESLIYVKNYAASATTGIITFSNSNLKFRLSYQYSAGGVAEFRLDDMLSADIGLYFSSSEVLPEISGKGAAIANMSDTAADVTLYAIGGGSILDSYSTTINPFGKILGVAGSDWFASVSSSDIKKIIAVEESGSNCLTGVVICTNTDLSKLLFTPSAPVAEFESGTD